MRVFPSMCRGGLGFAVVSAAAFAVWAFGDAWFARNGGELALYAGCCFAFLVLSGLLLHPLVQGPRPVARFYQIFVPAFLLYTVAWCAGYFLGGAGIGEWIGSLAGSVAFTSVMAWLLKGWRSWPSASLVMFLGHSAGYFIGEHICYSALHSTPSMLIWGLCYGLGFGIGIGYSFAVMQRR